MKMGIFLEIKDMDIVSTIDKLNIKNNDKIPPHISLYILEIKKENIEAIKNKAEIISKDFLPNEITIEEIKNTNYGMARFSLKKSENLRKLHESLVAGLVKFRDKNAFSKAKKFYDTFSKEEKKLIDLYGRPNVLENFEPHISIGKTEEKIQLSMNKKTTINQITFYIDEGNGWEKS